jgi:hypothetical protein
LWQSVWRAAIGIEAHRVSLAAIGTLATSKMAAGKTGCPTGFDIINICNATFCVDARMGRD